MNKEHGLINVISATMIAVLADITVIGSPHSLAQAQAYPTRPITFVVPFTAGGTNDIFARLLGQKLEQRFGVPFVVENRPGAGSITATAAVARVAPDGYTILTAPSTAMAFAPTVYKKLPFDPVTDLMPIALLSNSPFVLLVKSSLPVNSVTDLVRLAKEKPRQLSYASAGPSTPHHLFAELLQSTTGIELTHVPYRGTVPALNDVAGGHVDLMFSDIGPALGLISERKLRALGVSTKARVRALSEVPPIAEIGVPEFDVAGWQMVVAPIDTPSPIVEKLHHEMKTILEHSEMKEQIVKLGLLPIDTPAIPDMQRFVKTEIAKWRKIVERAGIAGSQ